MASPADIFQVCNEAVTPFLSSYASLYWGVIASTLLVGVTILQGWIYITTNHDRWPLRCLVYLLILMDFAAATIVAILGHYNFISHFGDARVLEIIPTFAPVESLLTFTLTFIVQLFFLSRIHFLDRKNWLAQLVMLPISVASFVMGLVLTVEFFSDNSTSTFTTRRIKIGISLQTGLAALADIIATIFLTRAFSKRRIDGVFMRTKVMIRRLVMYIVTRGFLVATMQTITLVIYLFEPSTLSWTPMHFCMSRLYVITMVSILNARQNITQLGEASGPKSRMVFVSDTSTSDSHLESGRPPMSSLRAPDSAIRSRSLTLA